MPTITKTLEKYATKETKANAYDKAFGKAVADGKEPGDAADIATAVANVTFDVTIPDASTYCGNDPLLPIAQEFAYCYNKTLGDDDVCQWFVAKCVKHLQDKLRADNKRPAGKERVVLTPEQRVVFDALQGASAEAREQALTLLREAQIEPIQ